MTDHLPPTGVNLEAIYRQEIAEKGYSEDASQLEVVKELQRIADGLLENQASGHGLGHWVSRWFNKKQVTVPKGLYLFGTVGRGKTFMVDLMFHHLPLEQKRRIHFHRFMLSIHKQLNALKSTPDPLAVVARDIAKHTRLLCLDELFVEDITDAMVLAGLFKTLIEQGVVLIFTTNCEVDDLYRDGLQRERFLPAIELLKQHCVLHRMGGSEDYRLRALEEAETFITPHADDTDARLEKLFRELCGEEDISTAPLRIVGREIAVVMASEGVCWFHFDDLCDGPRSKADYVELSRYYHSIIVSEIPQLDAGREDPARRFVELVDELYDRRVNVVLSAAAIPEALYSGKRLAHSFERTASRIREFSSHQYLAMPHRP